MMRKLTRKMGLLCSLGLLFTGMQTYGQYCIPSSTNGCSGDDDVNTFILNGEGGTSINSIASGCSSGAYDDLTGLPPVSLLPGFNYTATVSSEYYDPFFGEGDYAAIWIDLDSSGTFETSERVGVRSDLVSDAGSPVDIAIPGTAPMGNRRMRVVVAYPMNQDDNFITAEDFDPCNTGTNMWVYGEAHDYMVNILPAPACLPPTSVTSTAGANDATVTWSGTGNFIAEYGPAGFTPGTGATAGANGTLVAPASSPQLISGLSSGTLYDVYIRRDCGSNSFSANIKTAVLTSGTPANDDCANAIDITNGSAYMGNNTDATQSIAPGNCADEPGTGTANDVWYKLTTIGGGSLTITQTVSGFSDLVLEVLSGSCSGTLTELECDASSFFSGTNSVTLTADPATTYYVRTYGYSGIEAGSFSLRATGTPLPVLMDEIKGKLLAGNLAQLSWTTFMEKNNKGFDVQRSEDGRTFSSIGWVSTQTEGGNSSQALRYQFTDKKAISDAAYYRLQQVDRDGKATLSNIVRLGSQTESGFNIIASPNPVAGDLAVRIKGDRGANATIYITDISGKVVMQAPVTAAATIVNMAGLAKGVYLLRYTDSNQSKTLKVTRQ